MAEVAAAAALFTAPVIIPLIASAVLGQAFATFYDTVKETIGGSLTEFKPLRDLESTLKILKPMLIRNIEDHNDRLDISNDVVKDLKKEMQEGVELVRKLAKCRSLQRLVRLRYSRRLKALDENLKALITELKLQETRDVKEVLKLVREQSENIEELKKMVKKLQSRKCEDSEEEEEVKETLALATKRQVRLTRLISMQEEVKSVMEVVQEEEEEEFDSEDASLHKYAAVTKAYMNLCEAVSEVNLHTKISDLTNYDIPLRDLKPLMEYISNRKRKTISSDVEVELGNLKAKMEEGEKLVRECLTISQYNPVKCFIHCTKLGENSGHLQRMLVSIYVALSENS